MGTQIFVWWALLHHQSDSTLRELIGWPYLEFMLRCLADSVTDVSLMRDRETSKSSPSSSAWSVRAWFSTFPRKSVDRAFHGSSPGRGWWTPCKRSWRACPSRSRSWSLSASFPLPCRITPDFPFRSWGSPQSTRPGRRLLPRSRVMASNAVEALFVLVSGQQLRKTRLLQNLQIRHSVWDLVAPFRSVFQYSLEDYFIWGLELLFGALIPSPGQHSVDAHHMEIGNSGLVDSTTLNATW